MNYIKENTYKLKEMKGILLISLMFLLVIFHQMFNKSFQHWDVSIVLMLFFFFCAYQKKVVKPNLSLIVFSASTFILVTLNYHLFSRFDLIPPDLYRTYKHLINQYIWFLPLIALPTIYSFTGFNQNHFSKILNIILVFLVFYLLYWGIALNFDRGNFTNYFNPVISYDITFISIALLGLCFSFLQQGKASYLSLLVSVSALFLLILHGSRGTWVGVPLALLILSIFYYRTQLKKVMLMLILFLVFIFVNLVLPSSPIQERVKHLKQDTENIVQNNFENSSGIRLYLWDNAIDLFKTSPILGVGMSQIEQENCKLQAQGKLPVCFQHQHSIYFHELAANGVVGILALFLTFLSAIFYFIRMFFLSDQLIKSLAVFGFIFVSYYMLSGLTEYYLFFKNTTYIFYLITASLMSFIIIQESKVRFKKDLQSA